MQLEEIQKIASLGESEVVEFKKSTSNLSRVCETLCAFLNGSGGKVFIGISPDNKLRGQDVSDNTLREMAHSLSKLDPPGMIATKRVQIDGNKEIVVLEAYSNEIQKPYTYEGRAYQRVGSTTSLMPPATFQRLLLDKNHSLRRWEKKLPETIP